MRNLYLDSLKGFAIGLVVIGHVLQAFVQDWQNYPILKLIYMFHMPLFITISGYFFSLSVQKYTLITYIKKIFHRLLLPSICWGVINCMAIIINKTIHNKPIDPLYCIQLVDGVTPVILSELEAPGYSQYLKSFELNGEKYLIGLGYTDGWQLKISLYKSNGENIQIGKDFVIDGYDCEVFENSMSLFFMRTDTGVEYGFKSYIYGTGNDYSIDELLKSLKFYYEKTNKRIAFEYILLDINPNSSEPVSTIQLFSEEINRLVCIDGYYYAASIYGTLTGYEKVDGKLVVVED